MPTSERDGRRGTSAFGAAVPSLGALFDARGAEDGVLDATEFVSVVDEFGAAGAGLAGADDEEDEVVVGVPVLATVGASAGGVLTDLVAGAVDAAAADGAELAATPEELDEEAGVGVLASG